MATPTPPQESGLALLGRLATRPGVQQVLGPLDSGREVVGVTVVDPEDSETVLEVFLREVVCRVVLPLVVGRGGREVEVGGCGAGVVWLDCDHRTKVRDLAELLGRKVKKAAEAHYQRLPKHRREERLTSGQQWEVVKEALQRVTVLRAYSKEELELSLHWLPSLLEQQPNTSCVLLTGITSFFHQARAAGGASLRTHVSRLLARVEGVTREWGVRLVYSQHMLFGSRGLSRLVIYFLVVNDYTRYS